MRCSYPLAWFAQLCSRSRRTTTAAFFHFLFFFLQLSVFPISSYPTRNVYNTFNGGAASVANFFSLLLPFATLRVIVECGAFGEMRSRRDFSYYSPLFVIIVSPLSVSQRSVSNECIYVIKTRFRLVVPFYDTTSGEDTSSSWLGQSPSDRVARVLYYLCKRRCGVVYNISTNFFYARQLRVTTTTTIIIIKIIQYIRICGITRAVITVCHSILLRCSRKVYIHI